MKPLKGIFLLITTTTFILMLFIPGLSTRYGISQAQELSHDEEYFFPIFQNNRQNPYSTSYYLPTVDGEFLYGLGCDQGISDLTMSGTQDSVVVLNFSYPVYDPNFGYGAALFEDNPWEAPTDPVSTDKIKQAVKRFAKGYYNCSGADTESTLVVGVGTNNKGISIETKNQATEHGTAWGAMVSELNRWALDENILHQVQFYGASDMEIGWNTPEWTRAWIAGFEHNEEVFYLHFGDAAGCPYDDSHDSSCNGDWALEDVWYVSWGASSALPLPLIYRTDGIQAKQWAFLSRDSAENHGHRMDFTGVFTQWQYCQQYPDYCKGNYGSPIDNTPEEAYQQMNNELNKDPRTMQNIRWKTDIRWVRESEIAGEAFSKIKAEIISEDHPIQDEITKTDAVLEESDLSAVLRASLESKLNTYQTLAEWIEISRQTPALKK